jgi:chromosomal replication initiation ATPase DnaA
MFDITIDSSGRPLLRRPDPRLVESMVASAFAVDPQALRSRGRGRASAAFARQVAMYLAHTRLGLSFTAVGSCFSRDRTTAAHACRTVENRRENVELDTIIDLLERAIDIWSEPGRAVGS